MGDTVWIKIDPGLIKLGVTTVWNQMVDEWKSVEHYFDTSLE